LTRTISVIIVSFNVKDHLIRCLESLEREENRGLVDIIVVDNASWDGTLKILEGFLSDSVKTKAISNKENVGFARACNQGAKINGGEYLLFLNPDTVVPAGTLGALAEYMDRNQDVSIIGPRITYPDGSLQMSCGTRLSLKNSLFESFRLWVFSRRLFGGSHYRSWDHDSTRDVDWISGGCMMIKKEIFFELGGFDENYFLYTEDMDLCLRARLKGYRVVYWPKVYATHHEAQSSKVVRTYALTSRYRSRLYYFKKHHGNFMSQVHRLVFASASLFESMVVGVLGLFLRDREYFEILRAHLGAVLRIWFMVIPDPPGRNGGCL